MLTWRNPFGEAIAFLTGCAPLKEGRGKAVARQGWLFRIRHGQRLFVLFVGIARRAAASAAVLDTFKGGRIEETCVLPSELALFLNLYEGRIIKLPVMEEWPHRAVPRRIGLRARLRLVGQRRAAAEAAARVRELALSSRC
jgi:hypothetical protein